nr:MAG TPA: hypothetical protein [Caudoviricetes sp.]
MWCSRPQRRTARLDWNRLETERSGGIRYRVFKPRGLIEGTSREDDVCFGII